MAVSTKIPEGTASRRLRLTQELRTLGLRESDNPGQYVMNGFWSRPGDTAKQFVVRYTEIRGQVPTRFMVVQPALVLLWVE